MFLGASAASAAPAADRHQIKWFVHTDLVSGSANLAFYQAMIDAALDDALINLEGDQGPADTICCQKLDKEQHSPGVTLQSFGTPGDGLDVVNGNDLDTIRTLGGSGSRGFLVDSILNCGGSAAIGCADLASCNSIYDDDPNLVLIVTLDANDSGVLGLVIAHERGHHACLPHVTGNLCQLMQSSVAGGCLNAAECASYGTARQTSAGSCVCHAGSSQGTPAADATICSDGPISGLCSGGVCGETPGDAGVQLVAAGGPGAPSGQTPDDPLLISALTGGWNDVGNLGVTIKGLEYDADGDVLYGIRDFAGDDRLVTISRSTWTILTSRAITGHADVIALAFDPGETAGSGDNRLLALSSNGTFENLIAIAPATGSPTLLGGLSIGVFENFTGLAYDSVRDRIFASGFANGGLFEIDESSCDPPDTLCTTTAVTSVNIPRQGSSLAYSAASDALYLVGHTLGRTRYDAIDAATLSSGATIGIDPYTPGGLAAVPVPEPGVATGFAAGVLLLTGLARRSHEKRRERAKAFDQPLGRRILQPDYGRG